MQEVIALLERAIAILRKLSGDKPVIDPEEHERPEPSDKPVKLAVVVGHNATAKGAYSPILGSEYTFNKNDPASYILRAAEGTPCDVKVFYRHKSKSTSAELADVTRRVNEWNPDFAVSLHFNAFRTSAANGTETLHAATKGSKAFAETLQRCMLDCFGLNNRGLVEVGRKGRGGMFLYGVKATAALLEPGFGTNDRDAKSLASNWDEFSKDLIWIVRNAKG